MVELKTTLRGVPLVASPPDARYRRYHTDISPAPSVTRVGRAERVHVPARLQEREGGMYPVGTVMCAAYDEWCVEGRRVDPCVYFQAAIMRDGSDAHLEGCGRWALLDELIPADDPELLALRAELDELDAAWRSEYAGEIVRENHRTAMIARATVHDEFGCEQALPHTETECLECGAVYSSPGMVEAGGMSCRRCG